MRRSHALRSHGQRDRGVHGSPRYLGGGGSETTKTPTSAKAQTDHTPKPHAGKQPTSHDGKAQQAKGDKAHDKGKGHDKDKGHDKKDKAGDKDKKDKEKKDGKAGGGAAKGKGGGAAGGAGKGGKGAGGKGGGGKDAAKKGAKKEKEKGEDDEKDGGGGSGGDDAGSDGGEGADFDFIQMPAIPMARTGDIYPIRVEAPSPAILKAEKSIISESGITPKAHHDKVEMAMEAVTRAASESQVDMVHRVEAIAWETRWEIEKLADQIPGVVEGGCALINARIDKAEQEVSDIYEAQSKRIANYQASADADLVANRDKAMAEITAELKSGSAVITEFAQAAATAFEGKQKAAAAAIKEVPTTGEAKLLPVPTHGAAAPKPAPDAKPAAATFKTVSAAVKAIDSQLSEPGKFRLNTYENLKAKPVLQGWGESRQQLAVSGAEKSASQINSPTNAAQFLIIALGLTAPVAQDTEKDKPGNNKDEKRENDQNQAAQKSAKEQALADLSNTHEGVKRFFKQQRKKLTDNLRKTGRKIEKSLRNQARMAEVGIATAASQMAPAYPEAVKRLEPLVAPGHFLDSRALVPELTNARESILGLRLQHVQAARTQAEETLTGAREGFEEQRKSIWESAQSSADSIADPVTQTAFDFELAADSFTGQLLKGTASAMGRAREYAEKVAKRLLDDTKKIKKGMDGPLDESAANFLNGAISGEARNYARLVNNSSKDWNETGGPFQGTQEGVRADITARTKMAKDALPNRSTAAAVGLTLLSPIGGAAYLYATRSKEDDVLKALGGVEWPGAGAIEDMFNGSGPAGTNSSFGNLVERINDRMSDPQKRDALGLLSSNAGTRWNARKEISESSTGWFTGPSAATREEVMRGFSKEEASYVGPAEMEKHKKFLQGQLSGSELQIAEAYLDRDAGRVLAIRAEQKLQQARVKGDDAMVQFNDEMQALARQELGGTVKNAYVPQSQIDALMGKMYVAHAKLMDEREAAAQKVSGKVNATEKQTQGVAGKPPGDEKTQEAAARQRFFQRMKTRVELVQGPGGHYTVVEKPVDPTALRAIEAAITKTPEEAWVARAAYEVRRAEKDGKPSESTQNRLTRSLEDQELFQIERQYKEAKDPTEKAALKRQLDEARAKHDRKMAKVGALLEQDAPSGKKPDLSQKGSGTSYMTERVGAAFAGVNHGTQYGKEMIQGGRASLLTGIMLATDKWGTNDDLLRSTYSGRSKAEIAEANETYGRSHGGDNDALNKMLGISKNSDFFSETSGDLAQELKKLSKGEPKSDLDFAELAALEHEQQRVEGTGFIARQTMSGTAEQQELDSRKEMMARAILEAAGTPDADPRQVFGSDGSVLEPYKSSAFDKNGKLQGKGGEGARYKLRELGSGVRHAADTYRTEIDRQEGLLTSLITALAILVTVILLCIPGVNLVVAGIITAVVAGAATMTVKAGMRGKRYGWEEAAVDVGMTAIEAATAGIGGGLGRGAAQGAKAAGILGKMGAGLNKTLGKFGGTVAREAIVGAIGGAARTVIQDETWSDGLGAGLKKVALSGLKGAAASAASAAVSTAVSTKLTKSLEGNLLDASKASRMGKLGQALGPAGREMTSSVLSQTLGAMAATTTDILVDVASGHYHGTLKDALLSIGESGLREMFSATLRTGAELRNKARLQALRKAAQDSGKPLTDADLRVLRRAAISAGEEHYGDTTDDAAMRQKARAAGDEGFDPRLARMKENVEAGRRALDGLPPELRARLSGLDGETLAGIRGLMESPTMGTPAQRLAMLKALHAGHVNLSREEFMGALEKGQGAIQKKEAETAALHKQVRGKLGEALDGPARRYLKDLPLEGIDQLPPAELKKVSELIKSGKVDAEVAAQLYAAAKAKSPNLSEETFHRNLQKAVEAVSLGRQVERAATVKAREDTLGAFSEEGRTALENLSDASLRRVKKLIDTGEKGSNEIARESLYRAAAADSPGLERAAFFKHLDGAVEAAAARRNEVRREQRQARFERLAEYPPRVRGPLSALPEEALFQLRLAQARGEEISPQLRRSLHEAALRETPGVDLKRLNAAMDDAVKRPATALTGTADEALRKQLLASIPESLRASLREVPILVMKPGEFEAFTRSGSGDAVTLIVNGRPVVVMKEGASPHVLREEGLHALQRSDPRWKEHFARLDEAKLGRWHELPLEEQLTLYKLKLELELDAQQRIIGTLQTELGAAPKGQREELTRQLERAKSTLDNLGRRMTEVEGLPLAQRRAIETGLLDRAVAVPFLDQPPRLFAKGPPSSKGTITSGEVMVRGKAVGNLQVELVGDKPELALDPKFKLPSLAKDANGAPVRLVAYEVEGASTGAKLQVLHPDETNLQFPTKPPPHLLVLNGGRFELIPNTLGHPPIQGHQDVYYVKGPGGELTVQSWDSRRTNPWRLEPKQGGGFKIIYEVPFSAAEAKPGQPEPTTGPKPTPQETILQRTERVTNLNDPDYRRAQSELAKYFGQNYAEFRPVKALGSVDLVLDGQPIKVDLAELGQALANTAPGSLAPEHVAKLIALGRQFGLITADLTFSAGNKSQVGGADVAFLDTLQHPYFKALVREHTVHLLGTHPEFTASPHALIETLGRARLMGEQHSHLDANTTADFILALGDRGMDNLTRALHSEGSVKLLQSLDVLAAGRMTEFGQELAPSANRSVQDMALELVQAYSRYKSATGGLERRTASFEVRQALQEFLGALAIHRPADVALHPELLSEPTTRRFFLAYSALQGVVRSAVGEIDASVARRILGDRPSAGALAMAEVRFGGRSRDKVGGLLDGVGEAGLDVGFILSISKETGYRVLTGPEFDAYGFRRLVRDFFSGAPELRRLVGLDSSGMEGKSPVVHAREFSLRTLLNVEETFTRLGAVSTEDHDLRAQLRVQLAAMGEHELLRWVEANQGRALPKVFEDLQTHYTEAEAALHQKLGGAGGKEDAFKAFLATEYGGTAGKPGSGLSIEQLAHLNRITTDLLRRQGLMGTSAAPEGGTANLPRLRQLGLTIHTGEQLLARTPLELLADVDTSLRLGADRLGHAVILGMTGKDLVKLGLLKEADVAKFESQRVPLLERARRLGVVVELNITSNLVISNINIDLHAAAELTRQGLRVSVSTDDEVLLHTNVVTELHRYAQMDGVGTPHVVVAALEAFASRLGTWELQGAARLRQEWGETLQRITPETVRNQAIDAVIRRFLGPAVVEEARKQGRPVEEVLHEALDYVFDASNPKPRPKVEKKGGEVEPPEKVVKAEQETPPPVKHEPAAQEKAPDAFEKGPTGLILPVNGKVNVGGGLEKGSDQATNLNPIKEGSGGPNKGIPNHVKAGFEDIGELFEPGSAKQIFSNRLRFVDVDWDRAAAGARKIIKQGGWLSLNIWTDSDEQIATLEKIFRDAGFVDVKSFGGGSGTMIMGKG